MDRQSTTSSNARLKEFGPWTEQYSSAGKRYFYNRETEVSQWEKPPEWREYEKFLSENAANQSPVSSASGARIAPSSNAAGIYVANSADSATSGNNGDVKDKIKTHDITQSVLRVKRPKVEMKEEDVIGSVVFSEEQHRRFLRADAQTSTRRWPTEEWEQSAVKADAAAHNLTLQIIYVSCDLKSAGSLVKTAEMRSSLLAQKLQFIADHQRQLEASFALPSLPSLNSYQ
ncbi:WW domain-containing protein [Loa loa]|uniref:WW domain-containing protein n=1 Tax=Loa loa TaxID=7209 RepID=A0A1I7VME0_LOALO|nr:WW domain-containing protein [Loa loa]EFO22336.2 WW domain-containing protein [Loa loa]